MHLRIYDIVFHLAGFADAALEPIEYPTAPKAASDKLLSQLGMKPENVDLWEINEALSGVVLANMRLDKLSADKVSRERNPFCRKKFKQFS